VSVMAIPLWARCKRLCVEQHSSRLDVYGHVGLMNAHSSETTYSIVTTFAESG
jgi:hypothetical protein